MSNAADVPPLAVRINEAYATLSKQERLLADAVLACGRDLAGYTATELASRAQVSKATATRFFHRLGYTDFEEARLKARRDPYHGSPLESFYQDPSAPPGVASAEEHLTREVRNLAETFAGITAEDFAAAADVLAGARKTWIIGFRDSYPLALYASAMLSRVLEQVCVVPRDGNSFAEDLIGLGRNDAVLAIGFRRRPRIFSTLMQVAREQGAGTVLLTDANSGGAAIGMLTFRCYVRGGVFDSHAAGLSVLNMLCSRVVLLRGGEGRSRLEAAETLHASLKDLTAPPPPRAGGR